MSTELESCYLHEVTSDGLAEAANSGNFLSLLSCKGMFLDLQVVTDSSARGTFNTLQKLLRGVGCWRLPEDDEERLPPLSRGIRIIFYVSDAGPDQIGYRKMLSAAVASFSDTLFVSLHCMAHQCQLIVRSGLVAVDVWLDGLTDWTYFASLAKISQVMRDRAKAIHAAWLKLHGPVEAQEYGTKLTPKCIAGRWGSISATETDLLRAGPRLGAVLRFALTGCVETGSAGDAAAVAPPLDGPRRGRKRKATSSVAPPLQDDAGARGTGQSQAIVGRGQIEDPQVAEMEAYKLKMGRWRKAALAVSSDPVFWMVVDILHRSHCQLDWMFNSLKVTVEGDDSQLFQLACGKGLRILNALDNAYADGRTAKLIADKCAEDPKLMEYKSHLFCLMIEIGALHAAGLGRVGWVAES
jgi:hypothetical protein